jgi:hypothetical protein
MVTTMILSTIVFFLYLTLFNFTAYVFSQIAETIHLIVIYMIFLMIFLIFLSYDDSNIFKPLSHFINQSCYINIILQRTKRLFDLCSRDIILCFYIFEI